MESTSNSTARFRFRDHNQALMADDDSSEGHTSGDSLSISSNEDEEPELQSMTAKGVQHLCSELLELKEESDEDFQKNIFSNYSAFLAILREIDGLQTELLGLKSQAFSQRKLIKDISNIISLKVLSEDAHQGEPPLSSPSTLEIHTENVSDILDTLLLEHRLDDALAILEMEGEFILKLKSGEKFPSNQLMSYNSIISEKRAMISDHFTLIAKSPRVSAAELQKALLGLCQIGENHLAMELMLQYYHSRIYNFLSSKELSDVSYIQQVTKYVCSMISQAVKSFVALNGEAKSEITQWASEEIRRVAVCFNKYIESISEISSRLATAMDAMQTAISYCTLLETQGIFLKPLLMDHIRPSMEEVFKVHIDHLSRVIKIFTSDETWVLGRYNVSGTVDQETDYYFLTNSGRKFLTLFQSVAEDISPLIAPQMESSVLKGMMDLLTAYIIVLESALTGDTEVIERGGFRINLPESTAQGVFILANLSTLIQLSSSIVKNLFDGVDQLDFEIDNYMIFVQDIYGRLKAGFLEHFVSNIFSPNVDHDSGSEICIGWHCGDPSVNDMIPSLPCLELYLELKKLQKFVEEESIDINWLGDLLMETMDAAFEWISSKSKILTVGVDNLTDHRTEVMQFILDAQFLVEIARGGGYLSQNVLNISSDIKSRLEHSIRDGSSPLRDLNDEEWPANAALQALHRLQELQAQESLENEMTAAAEESFQLGTDVPSDSEPSGNDEDGPVQNAVKLEVGRIEDTPIENNKDLEEQKQKTSYNKKLYEEDESEKNEPTTEIEQVHEN